MVPLESHLGAVLEMLGVADQERLEVPLWKWEVGTLLALKVGHHLDC